MQYPFPVPDTNEFRQQEYLSSNLTPGKYAVFTDDSDTDPIFIRFEYIEKIEQMNDHDAPGGTYQFDILIKERDNGDEIWYTAFGLYFIEIK